MFLLHDKTQRTSLRTSAFLIIVIKVLCCQTLTCRPEEYQIGNKCCPKCPPGNRVETDCTESTRTSCLSCMSGTYMDEFTKRTVCFPCTNCDTGPGLKVKRSCTTTSDTVCEPLEGFFCTDITKDQCEAAQKHKDCDPGQYIKEKGTSSSDTVCSDCSDGTFSDGTLTSCHQHTQCESMNLQLKTAGTKSTDSVCGEKTSDAVVMESVTISKVKLSVDGQTSNVGVIAGKITSNADDTVDEQTSNVGVIAGKITSNGVVMKGIGISDVTITVGKQTSNDEVTVDKQTSNDEVTVDTNNPVVVSIVLVVVAVLYYINIKNKCPAVPDKNNHADNSRKTPLRTRQSVEESKSLSEQEEVKPV